MSGMEEILRLDEVNLKSRNPKFLIGRSNQQEIRDVD